MNRWHALVLVLPGLSGCGGVPSDPGLFADMRVAPGSYVEGSMPEENGGPGVVAVDLGTNRVRAGQIDKPLRGSLAPEATSVALGLAGDTGYWIVPAGLPDVQSPAFPTFDISLSFSPDMRAGSYELLARAVDADDHFGPASRHPLKATAIAAPNGKLVVSLRWDREADLDLHVVDPHGVEIYKRNINSYELPPPGQPVDPTAWQSGAILDFDSNAGCVIDGRRIENVVWKDEPPPGHYIVRVDTFSLCGEGFANWSIDVLRSGVSLARSAGQSGPTDEAMPHDRGAGVLAVEFDLP
ncbi:hypothetical protein [Polyangium jinanense]|uniref:Lipoprotein n=1 Tax=Polyangium jinanense TaxID=2829994 RepID=A0A9X3X2S8_9BACT|nr:hypothetical protein [Polyangium jinanense]MDC3955429.1 hypothetical protein [Polyangium jinanense]MDC3981730.1 hypothetical protein [Polyangium jinanense]